MNSLLAQDVIILQDGESIDCDVVQMDTTGIYYVPVDSVYNDTLFKYRHEVYAILYEGGFKQIVTIDDFEGDSLVGRTPRDLMMLGRLEAREHHRHLHRREIGLAATFATLGTTCGICGNAIWASIPPSQKELRKHPEPERLENEYYYKGYRNEKWKLRARNIGVGTAIPVGIVTVIVILASGLRLF